MPLLPLLVPLLVFLIVGCMRTSESSAVQDQQRTEQAAPTAQSSALPRSLTCAAGTQRMQVPTIGDSGRQIVDDQDPLVVTWQRKVSARCNGVNLVCFDMTIAVARTMRNAESWRDELATASVSEVARAQHDANHLLTSATASVMLSAAREAAGEISTVVARYSYTVPAQGRFSRSYALSCSVNQ